MDVKLGDQRGRISSSPLVYCEIKGLQRLNYLSETDGFFDAAKAASVSRACCFDTPLAVWSQPSHTLGPASSSPGPRRFIRFRTRHN